jgi:WD40 repeat protein
LNHRIGVAAVGVLAAGVLAGCAQPVDAPGSPLDGLHACAGAGPLIGVFAGQDPTSAAGDGPAVESSDTWGLTVGGAARRLTDDGVHVGAVISSDGLSVYQLRSSGRILGDSLEAPSVIERRDVRTGRTSTVAHVPAIVDLAVSGDGRRLAAAHMLEAHPDTGLDVNTVAVIDLAAPGTPTELSRAPDVPSGLYSAVDQVALSPTGDRVAYALAVEVSRGTVMDTLRIRDLASNADTVVYTASGTDFLSDMAWSPDGATVLAAIRYQQAGDSVESPARFRTLRFDVAGGRTTLDDGYAADLSPRSLDGSTLLGLAPTPDAQGDPRGRALISWDRRGGVSDPLSIDHGAAGISVAACSYR